MQSNSLQNIAYFTNKRFQLKGFHIYGVYYSIHEMVFGFLVNKTEYSITPTKIIRTVRIVLGLRQILAVSDAELRVNHPVLL